MASKTTGPLADLEVLDPRGEGVKLADVWREQPAVIAFVRHFG